MSQEPPISKELWDLIPPAAQAALLAYLGIPLALLPVMHPTSSARLRGNPPAVGVVPNRDTSPTTAPCCPPIKKCRANPRPAAAAARFSLAPTHSHSCTRYS